MPLKLRPEDEPKPSGLKLRSEDMPKPSGLQLRPEDTAAMPAGQEPQKAQLPPPSLEDLKTDVKKAMDLLGKTKYARGLKATLELPPVKFALGGLISHETASKLAEKTGARFPKSQAAQIGAAAIGAAAEVISPADLALFGIGVYGKAAKAYKAF